MTDAKKPLTADDITALGDALDLTDEEKAAFDAAIAEVRHHPLDLAKDALWDWQERTHGNEFGHDHHCPIPHDYEKGPWINEPGDPEVCTCGWSAFRIAYAAYGEWVASQPTHPSDNPTWEDTPTD
jgi:hypothetical protein